MLSTSKSINTVSSAVRSTDGTSLNPCSISLAVSSATEPLNSAAEILIACSNASSREQVLSFQNLMLFVLHVFLVLQLLAFQAQEFLHEIRM